MTFKKVIVKLILVLFFISISATFSSIAYADSSLVPKVCTCKKPVPQIGQTFTQISDCGVSDSTCIDLCGGNSYFVNCVDGFVTPPTGGDPNSSGSGGEKIKTPPPPLALPNPLGTTDINSFIARLINFVLSLVGSVSLLLFIYGGIIWMTSAGAPAQVKKGRDIVIWAVIGLAVVFTSYILVKFVIQGLGG